MSAVLQVGWVLSSQKLAIKQGSSGAIEIVSTLSNDSGVDYNAWDCRIVLVNPFTQKPAIDLTPAVVGDAGAKTLTAVMMFLPETTADLPPGVYLGDIKFSSSPAVYFSADLQLTIEASAS